MEYGSRVGIWRICRMIDRYQIPVTFAACALAVERNPPLAQWLAGRAELLRHLGRDEALLIAERERAMGAIRANGLRLIKPDGSEEIARTLRAVESCAEAGPHDLVFLALSLKLDGALA